eukprot:TRINITY_DN17385_c0_g1_i1.p1 TRINITY_DN17385_c0_g1~~TRINITY_DN17385_c0_g1_i1.p1  ORF type:complete len:139 (+),score=29.45 TRINITY_DN17385_c0_g1_i1:51-419(+)
MCIRDRSWSTSGHFSRSSSNSLAIVKISSTVGFTASPIFDRNADHSFLLTFSSLSSNAMLQIGILPIYPNTTTYPLTYNSVTQLISDSSFLSDCTLGSQSGNTKSCPSTGRFIKAGIPTNFA